jgi:hypothetical protein
MRKWGLTYKLSLTILDYSLFACPVDGRTEAGDGTTATREMIEALKKRIEEVLAARASPQALHGRGHLSCDEFSGFSAILE